MSDRAIFMSGPMVRSLIRGDKTETRRIGEKPWKIGDRLWVREAGCLLKYAFRYNPETQRDDWEVVGWRHAADNMIIGYNGNSPAEYIDDCTALSRPSIHMSRWASRLTLLIREVRSEPLHDITEAGAIAEGIGAMGQGGFGVYGDKTIWEATAVKAYAALWDVINGAGAWTTNPLVTVTRFEVLQCNIDKLDRAA